LYNTTSHISTENVLFKVEQRAASYAVLNTNIKIYLTPGNYYNF